jgi:hypothetical protein
MVWVIFIPAYHPRNNNAIPAQPRTIKEKRNCIKQRRRICVKQVSNPKKYISVPQNDDGSSLNAACPRPIPFHWKMIPSIKTSKRA